MIETYLGSIRTKYRILEQASEFREHRDQLRHPDYQKPQLLAASLNQVWSWDITKLLGPRLRLPPLDGRVHFLVHSWSDSYYFGFQSAILVAIRAAQFQTVTNRWGTVTAGVASSSLVVPAISFTTLEHGVPLVEAVLHNISQTFE